MGRVLLCTVIFLTVVACSSENSDGTVNDSQTVSTPAVAFIEYPDFSSFESDNKSNDNLGFSPQGYYRYLLSNEESINSINLIDAPPQLVGSELNSRQTQIVNSYTDTLDNSVSSSTASRNLLGVSTLIVQNEVINIMEDTAVYNLDLLANDLDTAGNTIYISNYTQSRQGGRVLQLSSGLFEYTPPKNFNGEDWFSYVVTNNVGESAVGVVLFSITAVDDFPISKPDYYFIEQNNALEFNVLINDTGLGDGVFISITSNPENGQLTFVNGNIRYVPNNGFEGLDSFVYRVTDANGDFSTANVSLTIQCASNCSTASRLLFQWDPSISSNVTGYRLYIWNASLSFFDVLFVENISQVEYCS